jgi:hypothetical protein
MEDKVGGVSTVSLNRDDIAAAEENCEHRLLKPGRRYGHGGHGIVSTVSLNRDDIAGAEDTGWMPRRRIVSTVSLNRDEDLDSEDTGS